MTAATKLKLTLVRSPFGRKPNHMQCVRGLGLRQIGHTVVVNNDPCIRGMIAKISYLLKVEDGSNAA